MTLLIFRSRFGSDCPSPLAMPPSAGPPPQQPCQFSSPFVSRRLVAHPSTQRAFCVPDDFSGSKRLFSCPFPCFCFPVSIFQFQFSEWVFLLPLSNFYFLVRQRRAGVCRRRGPRERGGGRRVRWRSSGPRGRAGGENRRQAFLLSASCILCSSRPGCGRNCTPTAPAAPRGPGTAPLSRSGAYSKSIGRVRARGWLFAASCSAESLPPRC